MLQRCAGSGHVLRPDRPYAALTEAIKGDRRQAPRQLSEGSDSNTAGTSQIACKTTPSPTREERAPVTLAHHSLDGALVFCK